MIISIESVYIFTGIITFLSSLYTFFDKKNPRRITSGLFYLIYAITLMCAKVIPSFYVGILVLVIVAIAGFGGVRTGSYGEASSEERQRNRGRLKNWLFLPALLIPLVTVGGVEGLKDLKIAGKFFLDPSNVTMVALGLAGVVALVVGMLMTKSSPVTTVKESRRLIEAIGWAAVLPQMLAMLGTIFDSAGVGNVVSKAVDHVIPSNSLFWAVFAYCVGMALFTMVMGNAFAAFPVMTAGIALPLIIGHFGVQADKVAAIGMFAGYCGTLMTPMAANFNIVPAALLDLKDKNYVIRTQFPTAIILLGVNIILMYLVARF
ncbi:DUF979 domain-containing protein [Alicyclobacillus fastidiosus]|uniref:DUF979 domain-containing protein n=1 Tax=Alicyclobacillus fastidiosus TaxID=392011 RepID=A0ABV5AE92_9BACL|nr:DUF979 domain-containing protein [Alicyclobacillus fastidiosus]WEH09826.1 DUF979 domain-containing protein [Alicyclobacillus fastidiosus]